MKESRYDRVLVRMLKRMESVSGKIALDLKGTKPFDKQPISSADEIYRYNQISPEVKDALRQNMPQTFGDYENRIQMLQRRYHHA